MPHPPERYQPGELEKTRKNLGALGENEARQMKEKLGGEVGVEKAQAEIDARYKKLQEENSERNASKQYIKGSETGPTRRISYSNQAPPGMKFWDRFRLDWHLASLEYRAKSRLQAVGLFFNRTGPDRILRSWILEADRRWFKSLENLTLAVRGLTAKQHKNALQSLRRTPLYYDLLRIIREWDVEGIGRFLTTFQRDPGNLNFSGCAKLALQVLRPFFILSSLDPVTHIQAALAKLYDLAKIYLTTSLDMERLRKYYAVARDEVPHVFPKLKNHMYPILVKNLASEYMGAPEFFAKYRTKVLEFLDIPESEILSPTRTQANLEPIKRTEVPEPAEDLADKPKEKNHSIPSRLAAKGRDLVTKIFPASGMEVREEDTDTFAYFSPLLNFPRGTELIAREDPLLQVITLALIVDQYFFGMENFRMNPSLNPTGANMSPVKQLDQIATEWRRFLTEIVSRRYLSTLQDYCRAVERGGRDSPEARRNEEQLFWIRKNGILPLEPVPLFKETRSVPLGATPLFRLITELTKFLSVIAVDTEKKLKPGNRIEPVLLNPLEMFKFDIDSPLSRRLHSLYKKVIRLNPGFEPYADNRNNRTFLFSALSTALYLEYLINDPGSPANQKIVSPLYRTLSSTDPTPVYNVRIINTQEILEHATHQETMDHKRNINLPVEDDLADFYSPYLFRDELKGKLRDHHSQGGEGGLLHIRTWLGKDLESENLTLSLLDRLAAAFEGRSTNRVGQVVTMLWSGPPQDAELSLKNFVVACASPQASLPLHAIWIPFFRGATMESLEFLAEKGLRDCESFPPQVFGTYESVEGNFQFSDDLPLCADPAVELLEEIPLE